MFEGQLNSRLLLCVFVSSLGASFQNGYNIGVINSPQATIETWIAQVIAERQGIAQADVPATTITFIWSGIVAIYCVGGMMGAVSTKFVAETFGRKGGLLFSNVLVVIAALLLGFAKPVKVFEMLLIGRLVIGIYCGLNAGLCPMYLNEISPVSIRGAIGSVFQLILTIAIMVAQIMSMEWFMGTEALWPYLLAFILVPGIIQCALLPFCAESPRYLFITKELETETTETLTWLRDSEDVEEEVQGLRAERDALQEMEVVTLKDMFQISVLRKPLIISCVVMMSQQFSGINAVMYFSTHIFNEASLSMSESQLATLGMGTINVLMTVVSLVLVEMAGRRVLLFIGYAGMCGTTVLLTICLIYVDAELWVAYFTILLVIIFVVFFATGPGSIPWFLVAEMFGQSARSTATSVAVLVNWTCNFIVAIGFLPLQNVLGSYVFVIFVILLAIFAAYVFFQVPETKGRTIEEVTALFT
ncbi:solute carrier family 2, facilitated glucose transporter member 1-like [Bacillus rossius redtenbacheri]|uniref:solute carrier family 2, facilitated glucose transporter member 1-like n=1 Tax=Bacillus rossius redtenbacheri TaxID=93214 RepID=UPI002FDD79B0